jgi:hypothetical protein
MQRGSLLNVLEERGAGRIETWPAWVRQMVLSQSPLKVGDRFATTLFLLGNGVLPRAIAAYLAGSGLLSDPSAHAHVWCVMRDFRDGALRSDAQYYCMRLQCNVHVHEGAMRLPCKGEVGLTHLARQALQCDMHSV